MISLFIARQNRPFNQPEVILAIKRMNRKIGRAQQQATPNKPLLNNCDNSIRGFRNQVLLRIGYETMRRRSEFCAFKFKDICKWANGKPANRLNFSKTDQFGTGKILPISQELFHLLEKWRSMISDECYILQSISRHGHIGSNLHPASVSTILKGYRGTLM